MMTVYCSACGEKLADDAAFCWKCGTAQTRGASSAPTPAAPSASKSPVSTSTYWEYTDLRIPLGFRESTTRIGPIVDEIILWYTRRAAVEGWEVDGPKVFEQLDRLNRVQKHDQGFKLFDSFYTSYIYDSVTLRLKRQSQHSTSASSPQSFLTVRADSTMPYVSRMNAAEKEGLAPQTWRVGAVVGSIFALLLAAFNLTAFASDYFIVAYLVTTIPAGLLASSIVGFRTNYSSGFWSGVVASTLVGAMGVIPSQIMFSMLSSQPFIVGIAWGALGGVLIGLCCGVVGGFASAAIRRAAN